MPSRDRVGAVLVVLLAAMSGSSRAQSPTPAAKPTYRAGVDLVVVEVVAVDRSGDLAKGLTATDFKVEIGGDARDVATVDMVAHETSSNARAPETQAGGGPDVSLNTEEVTNRRVLLIVDQGSLGPDNSATLIAGARRWLETLDPTDRVGLVSLPPPGPVVEFTTNHQHVAEALTKVAPVGGVPPAAFSVKNVGLWEAVRIHERDTITRDLVVERECYETDRTCPMEIDAAARDIALDVLSRMGSTLGPLRNMLSAMRALPGPKHAVLLSAGWPLDPQALGSKLEPVAIAAANAHVILHAVITDRVSTEAYMRRISPTFVQDRNMLHTSVETLAGWTGGESHRISGEADVAFVALNRAMAGYYRVGVRPKPEDLDGKAHRISVKITRPGVSIRSHRRVIAASNEVIDTQHADPDAALRAALLSAAPPTALALRATSYFLHEDESAPDRLRVLAVAEIAGGAAGPATVRLGLFDENGRLVTGIDRDVHIPERGPASVSAALHAPSGMYSLRIAARDREGRVGAVQRDVDLQWQELGSLKTTGLALFHAAVGSDTPEPLVDSIGHSERLIAQLAFSGIAQDGPTPSPVLEITPDGGSTPVLRQPIRVSRMEDGTRWLAQHTIPMTLLPPGSYTVTAVVAAGVPPLRRRIDVMTENEVSTAGDSAGPAVNAAGTAVATPAASSTRLALASLAKPPPFDPSGMLNPARLGPVLMKLAARDDVAVVRDALQRISAGPWPRDPNGPLTSAPVASHFVAGLGELQANDLEAAAVQFRLAMRAAPDFGPAMAYLAACYAAGGKHKEAAGAWQAALVRERDSPWLHQLAIEAWLRAERPATALALAQHARKRFPDEQSFARLEVRATLADGRAREGLEQLESMRDPDASLMLMGLATLYTAAKDGTPIWDRERDLDAMTRWRDAYAAAGGDSLALVNTWMTEVSAVSRRRAAGSEQQ